MENSLLKLDEVRLAIEAASTVQEIKKTLDMATAAKVYAEQARLGKDIEMQTAEYIVRAERKLGEIIKAAKEAGQITSYHGNRHQKKKDVPGGNNLEFTLEEAGITRKLSSRAQKISAIPDADFEKKVTELKESGKLTANTVVRSRHQANGEKPEARRSNKPAKEHDRQGEVAILYDEGKTANEIAVALSLTKHQVANIIKQERAKRGGQAQASVAPETLSMTAQQKLETAIRQHKERLTAEWRIAVGNRVDELLVNTIGPKYQKEQKAARRIIESRKGIMGKEGYRKILSCLHPDWVTDPAQKARYEEAFNLFKEKEKLLLNEKDSPTEFVHVPTNLAEWDIAKRQTSEMRKAKRNGNGGIQIKRA